MKRYTKYKTQDGTELCMFPMETLRVGQGPGYIDRNTVDVESYSHAGSWAIDNSGEIAKDASSATYSDVFAPVTLKLVTIYTLDNTYNTCIFSSINKVKFPNGDLDYLDMSLTHCEDAFIGGLGLDRIYEQGDWIYKEGWNGGPNMTGPHVHIEARKRGSYGSPTISWRYFDVNGNLMDTSVGCTNSAWSLVGNQPVQEIFFINDTTRTAEVPDVKDVPDWTERSTNDMVIIEALDASGIEDGWYEIYGKTYYVLNERKLTSWQEIDGETYYMNVENGVMQKDWVWLSDAWYYFGTDGKLYYGWLEQAGETYYLDPDNYGAMINEDWATIDGEYYYFKNGGQLQKDCWILDGTIPMYYVDSTGKRLRGWVQLAYPEETAINWFYFNNPNDYNVAGLNSGQLARNKWIASGGNWYYVGQEGKMLTSDWVAADSTGDIWYYVLSDGVMAYSCQVKVNGYWYKFNASGVCLNPNTGSQTQFSTSEYPVKS